MDIIRSMNKKRTETRQESKRLLLRLTPELHSQLHTVALRERRTMTNMVVVLVEDGLKNREGVMR